MNLPRQKIHYGVFIILIPLAVAFSFALYNSAKSTIKPYQKFRERVRGHSSIYGRNELPKIPFDQVVLNRGEKIIIKNSGLVYKGVSNGFFHIDLYLMDFDPDMPYSKGFSRQNIPETVWLGDVLCRVVGIKKEYLRLKIIRIRESG